MKGKKDIKKTCEQVKERLILKEKKKKAERKRNKINQKFERKTNKERNFSLFIL